jgi:hypothetical protein
MKNLKVAILTRPQNASPKVLAHSLQGMLERLGVAATIFADALPMLGRHFPLRSPLRHNLSFNYRLRLKLAHYLGDRRLLNQLAQYDAFVVSECTPNAFWKGYYDVEGLRRVFPGKPILLHEVYYLGCAPTQIASLHAAGDFGPERYDWHLAVSPVTEIRLPPAPPWSAIGLDLCAAGLRPAARKKFTVVVDFAQPGFERYRQEQLQALAESGVEPILLSGRYTIAALREIYAQAGAFFLQFPEAFGVSAAECLATGACIFTPDSSWPMSWRLNLDAAVHGPGELADCFQTYSGVGDLVEKLTRLRSAYNGETTPFKVFASFKRHYPAFYEGDLAALKSVLERIQNRAFPARQAGRALTF